MLKAVLFDMDGTLLNIDIEEFLRRYFRVLGPALAGLLGDGADVSSGLQAVIAGTEAMAAPHPGMTNREAFNARFRELTAVDLADPDAERVLEQFYRDVFPTLRGSLGPKEGASAAVLAAHELGLKRAVATNPIFPLSATLHRLSWAGFEERDFHVVTSYENMSACKPRHEYYRQVAELLGVDTTECVMVGDDALLDLAAADVGMRTFYVGPAVRTSATWSGTLNDLATLLPKLVE